MAVVRRVLSIAMVVVVALVIYDIFSVEKVGDGHAGTWQHGAVDGHMSGRIEHQKTKSTSQN